MAGDPFKLPFVEAEAFFKAKLDIPTERWTDLWQQEHSVGFMSAGAYQADLLNDLRQATDKAISGGLTKVEFRKEFAAIVERHGWQHKGGRNWRSDLIWDTNINTAYQAGRWQQFTEAGVKLLMYRHADGVINPRLEHVAWDGLVLPITDPWWQTHYPPNGWKCHCRAVIADGMRPGAAPEEGTYQWIDKHTGEVHTVPDGIDPGWAYNVGQAGAKRPAELLQTKLSTLPADIGAALFATVQQPARKVIEASYGKFIDKALQGEASREYALLGSLAAEDVAFLENRGETPQTSSIVINDRLISGKKAARHETAGNALSEGEWRRLPDGIMAPEAVYYDTTNGKLLYVQEALEDPRKIKVVVELDSYAQKLKQTVNLVNTVFKIEGNALEDRTRYIKVR